MGGAQTYKRLYCLGFWSGEFVAVSLNFPKESVFNTNVSGLRICLRCSIWSSARASRGNQGCSQCQRCLISDLNLFSFSSVKVP